MYQQSQAVLHVNERFYQNGGVSQFESGKLALVAFQKTNAICRFYISYSATVWPLIFKTIPFTDVKNLLILILKLPQGSNTNASNFTSLRMVLPKITKWRCISLQVWKVRWLAFPENELCMWILLSIKLYCNSLTTDLQDYHFYRCHIVCAKIDFKATNGKQHKLWLANFSTFVEPVK